MDQSKLKILLNREEGPKLDYKEKIDISLESGKKELVKDVIAIANSQGGRGHLVIGIEDKTKEIIGVDPEYINEERIQQIISQRCDPPINIRVEFIEIDIKKIGVITIFRSNKRPHQMRQNGAFYIRRGSTTDIARRDEIASMLQKSGIINNEQMPVPNVALKELDKDLVNKYLKKMNINDSYDNQLLSNLGIVYYDKDSDEYYPTIGGLLLFCKNPQLYLPHTGIRIIYYQENKPISNYFEGNLLTLIDNSTRFAKKLLDTYSYPVEFMEECISNAVVHRDYFDCSRETVIYIGQNKIEISNPGSISQKDTINNIVTENNPFRRNNWLYHRLLLLDDKNRFLKTGLGLKKIKDSFKGIGKVRFLNLRKKNLFKIILPGIKSIYKDKD